MSRPDGIGGIRRTGIGTLKPSCTKVRTGSNPVLGTSVEQHRSEELFEFVRTNFAHGTVLVTDGEGSYPAITRRLTFMLWPDSNEGQALTNLRHLTHTLRQASAELDQFLEVTTQTLRWRQATANWIDVAAFDAAQAAADAPGVTARHELEALRTAIDLYRGDQLEGCYDEWVLDVRERFRDRYLSHLLRLAEVLASDGDHAEAIRAGRELLRNDPLREETCRFLMRVHVAAGDRAAAVRVFHECMSTLQRELGGDPSAETLAAYAALTRSEPGAADPQPKRIAESVLVGRDR